MGKFKIVFVTVGTTKFDSLVETVCSQKLRQSLRDLGCQQLIIQYGRGDSTALQSTTSNDIRVQGYSLKPSIFDDIQQADLVISHAGAGSCLEVLRAQKPLIVVVNEHLMGNHQTELAEQLYHDGNVFYCTPNNLNKVLTNSNFNDLKPYERGSMKLVTKQLEKLMGFS